MSRENSKRAASLLRAGWLEVDPKREAGRLKAKTGLLARGSAGLTTAGLAAIRQGQVPHWTFRL